MPNTPHASGKDAKIDYYLNGSPVKSLDAKSWSVKRNVTSVNDGVGGEDRDRLDDITNFYEIEFEGFNQDMAKLDALLTDQSNDDAGVAPTDKQASIVIKPRDGTQVGYIASGCSHGAWEVGSSGRTDRIMTKVPVRAQYFDKAPI